MTLSTRSESVLFGIVAFVMAGVILALVHAAHPLPILVIGFLPLVGVVCIGLIRNPLSRFATVMVLFALQARFTPDVTLLEIVFLLTLLGYATWLVLIRVYAQNASAATGDALSADVWLLIAYAGAMALVGIVSGYSAEIAAKDFLNFFCLFLFFPTRDLIKEDRRTLTLILVLVSFFGAAAAVRNLLEFVTKLDNAVYLWQLMQGRVAKNEMLLYAGCVFSVGGVLWFEARWAQAFSLMSAALCMGGVLLTQFRAYYVVLLLAIGLVALLVEPSLRRRVLKLYGILLLLLCLILVTVLGPQLLAVAVGLIDRFMSIGQAGTNDLSILSRILETQVVLDFIWQSPIVGHGLGFEYGFFDPSYRYTWVKSYTHNTYLSILLELGLVGLVLLLWGWLGSIVRGLGLIRRAQDAKTRLLAVLIVATLAPLLLSALTSASFSTMDVFVLHAVLWGTAAGLSSKDRARV